MAIVSMRKLSVCANKKNRKAILEALQKMGVMEIISDADLSDSGVATTDTHVARAQFEKTADSFDRVLKLLAVYAPEKNKGLTVLEGKKTVSPKEAERVVSRKAEYLKDASDILKMDREISECRGTILKDENQIEALKPWMGLDVPMDFSGTKTTAVLIGTIPEPLGADALYAAVSEGLPEPVCISADVISSSSEMTCISVTALKRDEEKVESNLRAIGFSRPSLQLKVSPGEASSGCKADIRKQKERIEVLEKRIAGYADKRDDYRIAADYFRTRAEKYRMLGEIPQSEYAFFIEGWVPAEHADKVAKVLTERFGAAVEIEEAGEDEAEPTLLRNNRFSQSVEGVLES